MDSNRDGPISKCNFLHRDLRNSFGNSWRKSRHSGVANPACSSIPVLYTGHRTIDDGGRITVIFHKFGIFFFWEGILEKRVIIQELKM